VARTHAPLFATEAPYIAEMARLELRQRFGANAESAGYKMYTSIDGRLQADANRALRIGLIEYDRRHGFRGPVGHVELPANGNPDRLEELVGEYVSVGNLRRRSSFPWRRRPCACMPRRGGFAEIDWTECHGTQARRRRNSRSPPKSAEEIVARGDVVYVIADTSGHAQLGQVPAAQSALVAGPHDGSIAALVGGFDYFTNKYNASRRRSACPARASSHSCTRPPWKTASHRPARSWSSLCVGRAGHRELVATGEFGTRVWRTHSPADRARALA